MFRQKIVGVWRLLNYQAELTFTKQKVNHPYGKNPIGLLIYTNEGNMSGQVMNVERPVFTSDEKFNFGKDEEVRKAYEGYIAYYGKYEINEKEKYVSHFVEGSLIPNWVGSTQIRYFEFDGNDKLILKTPPVLSGGAEFIVTLTFERVE